MSRSIRGRTIVLKAETGLLDGKRVEVAIRPIVDPDGYGERLETLGGSLADLPAEEWKALDEIIRDRSKGSERHHTE